jgi:hypothetical protein
MAFSDPGKDRQILWSPGPQAPQVTVAVAVKRGDILGYSSGWKKAIATTGGVIQGRLVALADAEASAKVPVSHVAVVGGYSGATAGSPVYANEGSGNDGTVTQTAPSTTGDATTVIGIALSATEILFFLNSRADSTSS